MAANMPRVYAMAPACRSIGDQATRGRIALGSSDCGRTPPDSRQAPTDSRPPPPERPATRSARSLTEIRATGTAGAA